MAPTREFVVQMYETEYRQIQAWVAKHQHIETGGDLFGLWSETNPKHTAVVQLVLGPGKNCRRSAVSFYQDIDYLERVGNVLTSKEGLCHIGEWHSHHRIGLTRPSGGDENTVWTNMDRYGIHRFFLFIATIGSSTYDVDIGCFLFEINPNTKRQLPVLKGKIRPFAGKEESPFRESAHQCLTNGAESINTWQWLNRFTGKRSFNDVEQHQNGKKARKNDPTKEACHTTQMSIDQNLTGESELENQEDKGESTSVKDRQKLSLYEEEEESQGNETGCISIKKDNIEHDKQQSDLAEDSKKPETQESQAGRFTSALSNDSHKEDRYTVKIQVMKESTEDDNQEVEPESNTSKDAENSKISQEIFSFPTADQKHNVELGKRQLNPTENNKSENLKIHSSVTAKENEDKDALRPKNAKKPKVQYLGNEEGKDGQEALHDQVSGDVVQATMVTNSKVIEVKPANEDSNPNQPQNSNTLDRNKDALKEQSSKVYAEEEIKDVQQNERKQPSTVCEEMEEIKSENETKPLVQDEGSDIEGDKSTSKSCFPRRKTSQDKEKQKKIKREEKNEKQIEKKRKKEEKKKQKKEEKKEKKKQKKEEKKKQEKEEKKEKKQKKKQKKEEKKKQKKTEKRGKEEIKTREKEGKQKGKERA